MTKTKLISIHKDVLILRSQQHIINELMKNNKLKIGPHMAFGHEANAIAIKYCFGKNDNLVLTHRNIAYNLAFEKNNLKKFIDEFNLKKTGINNGKNGSMNIINVAKGIKYTSSILGNNFSIALGISIHKKLFSGSKNFTYLLSGDGAMEEGSFNETLIVSRKFNTNLIIVIENNNFAMSSTIRQRREDIKIKKIAEAYDVNYLYLSSRNAHDYYKKIMNFKKIIIKNKRPGIIEIKTTMFNNHVGATPGWSSDPVKINIEKNLIIKKNKLDPAFVSKFFINKKDIIEIHKKSINELKLFLK
jgi:pyruvate dehydrogenase E1 component alpha subunit